MTEGAANIVRSTLGGRHLEIAEEAKAREDKRSSD